MEAGRSLLLSADAQAESSLQTELMEIQDRWRHAHHRLDQQRRELHSPLKVRGTLAPVERKHICTFVVLLSLHVLS